MYLTLGKIIKGQKVTSTLIIIGMGVKYKGLKFLVITYDKLVYGSVLKSDESSPYLFCCNLASLLIYSDF